MQTTINTMDNVLQPIAIVAEQPTQQSINPSIKLACTITEIGRLNLTDDE
jgi:hypothetical protein